MDFLRRVFGRGGQDHGPSGGRGSAAPETPEAAPVEVEPPPEPRSAPTAPCPYCLYPLDPPPERSRRCPSCRRRIVVRHADGRTVLLVESAVPIFDRERQHIVDEQTWTTERDHWLTLAEGVHAPAARRDRLAGAELSAEVVDASRALYLANAETAVRAARHARRWPEVARIRRQQAATLFHEAGSPHPPPDEMVALHRDGMLAELHALAVDHTHAELVSVGCCRACRTDDGRIFRITDELRSARLPHEGCPKGLCGCEWWLAMPVPKKRRRAARPKAPVPVTGPATTADDAGQGARAAPEG